MVLRTNRNQSANGLSDRLTDSPWDSPLNVFAGHAGHDF